MKSPKVPVQKSSIPLKKTTDSDHITNTNIFYEVLQMIDSLFNMRFIEKISSPISKQQR